MAPAAESCPEAVVDVLMSMHLYFDLHGLSGSERVPGGGIHYGDLDRNPLHDLCEVACAVIGGDQSKLRGYGMPDLDDFSGEFPPLRQPLCVPAVPA